MGEQVTYSLSEAIQETTAGTLLSFFEKSVFDLVRESDEGTAHERAQLFSLLVRFNTLYMISKAGSGHLGSSFSSMDIVTWLHLQVLKQEDRYFSSKGHDSPGLYALQIALGKISLENIHKLRRLGGLTGHPDINTPGAWANTGALGMGVSKAKGFVFADRLNKKTTRRIFVMTGDGELQEGQIWESLISAANEAMGEITVIVDHNKVQSDSLVELVGDLGNLPEKFSAFGWEVRRCDGHDYSAFAAVLEEFDGINNRPKVLIADTIKGSGVSFMEHTAMPEGHEYYQFHSGAPSPENYTKAALELIQKITKRAKKLNINIPNPNQIKVDPLIAPKNAQRLIPAYSEALLEIAAKRTDLIALDADLILDTGLIPFKNSFPERFIECGIAEQDMVSRAGAIALSGFLPVVHSFACFLTPRPNEQIYNAATERSKIIYVGSLAGLLPGGPGHSHQAVRDIAALSGVPGLVMIEPSTPTQVNEAVNWCVFEATGSTYLRLVSIPCEYREELQTQSRLVCGKGSVIRDGQDVALFAYGPVMLVEALKAADQLALEGISIKIINHPWLNVLDKDWAFSVVASVRAIVTLDNHFIHGGQGQFLRSELCGGLPGGVKTLSLGVEAIPVCGQNTEVLRHHRLDAEGIIRSLRTLI